MSNWDKLTKKPAAAEPPKKLPPGVKMVRGVPVAHRAEITEETTEVSMMREWIGPIALLILGTGVRIAEIAGLRDPKVGLFAGIAWAILGTLLTAAGLVAGVAVTALFMGSDLDHPPALARKALGTAIAALALAAILAAFDKEIGHVRGLILGFHAVLLMFFAATAYFMKMDVLEALVATVIAAGIHIIVLLVVGMAVAERVARLIFY